MSNSTHTLSVRMTADMNEAIVALGNSERKVRELIVARNALGQATPELTNSINQEILALKREQLELGKRAGLVARNAELSKTLEKELEGVGKGNGKFNQAIGQASFAVEDFMSVFETMGFSGAMRAAGNNLSMIGHILGGPLVGGAVGFSAVAAPMLINRLFGVAEASDKLTVSLQANMKALDDVQKINRMRFDAKFDIADIGAIDNLDTATDKLRDLERQLAGFQQDITETTQKKIRAQQTIMDEVSLNRPGVRTFSFLGKQLETLGDTAGKNLRDKVLPEIENEIARINERIKQDLLDDPSNAKRILEVAKKDLDALRQATLGEDGSINMSRAGATDLTNQSREVISGLMREATLVFNSLEDRLTLPQDKLKSLKEALVDLNKETAEGGERARIAETKILEIKKQIVELEKEAALEQRKNNAKALADLKEISQSEEERILNQVKAQEQKALDLFEKSDKGVEAKAALGDALGTIQHEALVDLSNRLAENTSATKDATITASSQAEASRQAVVLAERQMEDKSREVKDEVPRSDIVKAIAKLEDAFRASQALVFQSGGTP